MGIHITGNLNPYLSAFTDPGKNQPKKYCPEKNVRHYVTKIVLPGMSKFICFLSTFQLILHNRQGLSGSNSNKIQPDLLLYVEAFVTKPIR